MIPTLTAILILGALLLYQQHAFAKERAENAKERRLLLTRIQTPELAPALAHDEDAPDTNGFVAFDDDADFQQSVIERDQPS